MKVAKVLLRWYKSFNLNYMNYSDRRSGVVGRPWNQLAQPSDEEDAFRFIEISLEDDITTIVGGNESGKSHLLSAISKVLTGKGIEGAEARGDSSVPRATIESAWAATAAPYNGKEACRCRPWSHMI